MLMKKQPIRYDTVTTHGDLVYLPDPSQTKVLREDLVTHTQNINRYTGGLRWPILKHMHLVAALHCGRPDLLDTPLTEDDQLFVAYLAAHDMHESYVSDMPRPFKKYFPQFQEWEDLWEAHVHDRLGIPLEFRDTKQMKWYDARALIIETTGFSHEARNYLTLEPPTRTEMWLFKKILNQPMEGSIHQVFGAIDKGKNIVEKRRKIRQQPDATGIDQGAE